MAILDNIRNVMNKVIRIVCILLFAFMVIIGTYQILVRYISIVQVQFQKSF